MHNVYICMNVCVYVHINIDIYLDDTHHITHIHTYRGALTLSLNCSATHNDDDMACIQIQTRTYIHTCLERSTPNVHIHTYTRVYTYKCTCMHALMATN